jgi:hypothetical protein
MFNYFSFVLGSNLMADQIFMFMTTAGTMIGLAVLLFVSKGLRARSAGLTTSSSAAPPSSSFDNKSHNNVGRKVKKYSSDGKPIYED